MTAAVNPSADKIRRIGDLLAQQPDALAVSASRLFGGLGGEEPFAQPAQAIVNALCEAFLTGAAAIAQRGMEAGSETALFLLKAGDAFGLNQERTAFVQLGSLQRDIPGLVAADLQTTTHDLVARFIGGYVLGFSAETTASDFETIAIVVRRLGTARSSTEIGRVLTTVGLRTIHADAAWIAERNDDYWTFISQRGLRVNPEASVLSHSAIGSIDGLASGEPVAFAGSANIPESLRRYAEQTDIKSAVLAPLMIDGRLEAMLGFARADERPFTAREISFVAIISAQISARLRELRANARSHEAINALRESEQSVRNQLRQKERAVDILQHIYIPRALPSVPNLRFDALYLPAGKQERVGGDWYDVFRLDDGRLVFSVGDVAGHGLDAAVTMGLVRQSLIAASLFSKSPAELLGAMNHALLSQHLSVTTAIVGIYHTEKREVEYSIAGHPPPVFIDAGGIRMLPFGGVPLGIEANPSYSVERLALEMGAALVLYTDGLIEHTRDVIAGTHRLVEVLHELGSRQREPDNWAALIAHQVVAGATDDDLAILTIRSLSASDAAISSVQTHRDTIAWDFQAADIRSIALARNYFLQFITPLVEDNGGLLAAEIVLGELLSNAVEHAPGPVHVELGWDDATPKVIVRDRGSGAVKSPGLPNDIYSEHGRGMFIASSLSKKIETERNSDGGTSVTAWLSLQRKDGAVNA